MKRAGPIRRSALPKRSAPIAARSERREQLYAEERRPLVARLLATRRWCEACPVLRAGERARSSCDVHEVKSRARGGSITEEANLLCVCRPCHTWITTNPAAALALGLLVNSWS